MGGECYLRSTCKFTVEINQRSSYYQHNTCRQSGQVSRFEHYMFVFSHHEYIEFRFGGLPSHSSFVELLPMLRGGLVVFLLTLMEACGLLL